MPQSTPSPTRFVVADLPVKRPTSFSVQPSAADRAALAEALGITAIRKLRFDGEIRPEGSRDWRLEGKLGATVEQPCVVTLAPVATRIDTPVIRRFLRDMPDLSEDDEGEIEMPEDESIDPLGREIDVALVMQEALALNLPLYPRAAGAELETAVFSEPGVAPMRDEDAKPFAGLAELRDKLGGSGPDDGSA
ncbi:YceD family protein [Nioella nitratireducens]|uniref:YceD family protein n=1 Tax=Nioella nitratireducens TaxID=1287720 RepID=UPI0008FD166A|nr:DUF177 domain-containing protein [Nioella nitratireducens]